jgi:hypothetical protein
VGRLTAEIEVDEYGSLAGAGQGGSQMHGHVLALPRPPRTGDQNRPRIRCVRIVAELGHQHIHLGVQGIRPDVQRPHLGGIADLHGQTRQGSQDRQAGPLRCLAGRMKPPSEEFAHRQEHEGEPETAGCQR